MKRGILTFAVCILLISSIAAFAQTPNVRVRDATEWDFYETDSYFVRQIPDPAEPGSYVELRWKIENLGTDSTDGLIFQLDPKYPFYLDEGERSEKKIGELSERQVGANAYILYYKLRVDDDAVEGNNEVELRYSRDGGDTWIKLPPFQVRVESHDILLNIEEVKVTPEETSPGERMSLEMEIQNIAPSAVKNLKIELELLTQLTTSTGISTVELPFTPVGSSNEVKVRSLTPGEATAVEFDLVVDPDAEPGVYKIPITMEYQDDLGGNFSSNNVIGVIVSSEPDMSAVVDSSTVDGAGTSGEVNFRFVNKGVADIKFLNVMLDETDEYHVLSSKEYYVGNVDSDDYETASFDIFIDQAENGYIEFPVKVTYQDANNKHYEEDLTLKLRLYTEEERKTLGLDEQNNMALYLVLLAVVVIGFFAYKKVKKRKK